MAVSAPILGELVRMVRSKFYPTADDAVHAIHAHDVFSLHTPLVGMYSGISTGRPYVYHLGPMVFWALAVPERLFSERIGIVVAAAIVNVVAGIALVRSARRMYGATGALAAAALVAITSWSLGRQTLAEPWNPYIALIPLMLVLVYSLELANGTWKPLPWVALTGSFVVQAHYIYIPVTLAAIGGGLALGVEARRRARRESGGDGMPGAGDRRRWLRAAGAVTLVCWILPLVDVFVHWPGNFTRWVEALGHAPGVRLSVGSSWHYVVQAVGWAPLAARGPLPAPVIFDLAHVTALANAVAFAVSAFLVVGAALLWRSNARAARFAALGAVMVFAALFAVWRMPLSLPVIPQYRIVMLWVVSGFVWTALIVVAGAWIAQWELARRALSCVRDRFDRPALATAAVAASLICALGVESGRPLDHSDWLATRAVVPSTLQHLDRAKRYRFNSNGDLAYFVQYGLMRTMLDHGYHAFMPPDDVQLGRFYASDRRDDYILLVTDRLDPLAPGQEVVAEYDRSSAGQRARLLQAREASFAAFRAEPLRLTPYGERQRKKASGLLRIVLDAVAEGKATPDLILAASLDPFVAFSRSDHNPSRDVFVVGPDIVPTLTAYGKLRTAISTTVVRVVLIPPK